MVGRQRKEASHAHCRMARSGHEAEVVGRVHRRILPLGSDRVEEGSHRQDVDGGLVEVSDLHLLPRHPSDSGSTVQVSDGGIRPEDSSHEADRGDHIPRGSHHQVGRYMDRGGNRPSGEVNENGCCNVHLLDVRVAPAGCQNVQSTAR